MMVRQMVKTGSVFAQYLVPLLLLLGTAITSVKDLSRSMTYESVTGSGWFSKRGRPRKLDALNWRQFEELVHEYFRRNGYAVAETVPGPDDGVDLELRKDGKKATVQCKHWQRKGGRQGRAGATGRHDCGRSGRMLCSDQRDLHR